MAADHCWSLEKATSPRPVCQYQSNHKRRERHQKLSLLLLGPGQGSSGGFAGEDSTHNAENTGDEFDLLVGKVPWRRHGNSLQCCCLENPKDRGAWQTAVHVTTTPWARKFPMRPWMEAVWSINPECSYNLCLMQKLQSSHMLNLESTFNSKLPFITWLPLWAYLQEENTVSIAFHRILLTAPSDTVIGPWTWLMCICTCR